MNDQESPTYYLKLAVLKTEPIIAGFFFQFFPWFIFCSDGETENTQLAWKLLQ